MVVKPVVHDLPADLVVIVIELRQALCPNLVFGSIKTVKRLELGQSLSFDVDRPIVGASHAERAWSEQAGDFDVARVLSKVGTILTHTAALHRGRNHDGGE